MQVLVAVARLLRGTPIPRPLLAKQLADLLPRAFQYPDDCVAMVRINGQQATSLGHRDSVGPSLAVPVSNGSRLGELRVTYLHDHPEADEGPFLHDERRLLESVADLLWMHLREQEAAKALRESKAQFRAFAENSPDNVARYDRDCRRLYVNPALGELAGRPPHDLLGGRPSEGPMPPEVGAKMEEAIREVFDSGRTLSLDVEAPTPEGTLYLSMQYTPELDERGRVVAVAAVGRDVTELKRSLLAVEEERRRMKDLLDNLDEAFFSVEPDSSAPSGLRFVLASKGVEKLLGRTMAEIALSPLEFLDRVHPDDRARVEAETQRFLAGGGGRREIRYRLVDPDGAIRVITSVTNPVYGPDGSLVRLDGYSRDITAELEAQADREALKESQEKVERLEEMSTFRAQFLNMAAHELNTPLTPLALELDLLKAEKLGPLADRQRTALEMLERNVRRLKFLVQDMLDAGRMQTGRLKINARPADLGPLLREVVETFDESAKIAGVDLRLKTEGELLARMDPYRIEQALVNLVSNAIRYSPDGGVVLVSAHVVDGYLRVEVQDHGMGLNADQIDRLFQPFTQVHEGNRVRGGTGLGLYISKGIIDAHGGEIGVSSPGPDEGSTFWIMLPVKGPADKDGTAGGTAEGPPKTPQPGV